MKPTPPPVSKCIADPQGIYPDPPASPQPGESITDNYLVALADYINVILGIATTDRHNWSGENDCLRELQKAGQIR